MHSGGTLGTIAALGAALVVAGGSGAAADSPCAAPAATVEVAIAGVTAFGTLLAADGGELVLAGLAFRPVPGAEGRPDPELAAAVTQSGAAAVRIAAAGDVDRYGRPHAHVFLSDGRWLQAELVSAGLAIARPGSADARCDEALIALEAGARRARKGLWADSRIPVKASDRSSLLAQSGLYGVVEGRVVSIGYGTRMVFLDFGRDIRTDFTVMVPTTIVPRLLEAGIAVESLAGRAVRVRGVIEESGGPAIRLADPLELELLNREQ